MACSHLTMYRNHPPSTTKLEQVRSMASVNVFRLALEKIALSAAESKGISSYFKVCLNRTSDQHELGKTCSLLNPAFLL